MNVKKWVAVVPTSDPLCKTPGQAPPSLPFNSSASMPQGDRLHLQDRDCPHQEEVRGYLTVKSDYKKVR